MSIFGTVWGNIRSNILCVSVAALCVLAASSGARGQALDNKGTDFILAFLPNFDGGSAVELHLTSDTATSATVEYPVNSPTFTTTVAVNPGSVTIVTVPTSAANSWPFGTVANNAVRVSAPDEVVCYLINRLGFTSDAALGLPVDTMNTAYIVIGYTGASHGSDAGEFAVVAGFDDTTVTITPSNGLVGGFGAGVPFSVTLDRGEGFLGRSATSTGAAADLTGTVISADRPVGVTNGNRCTNVPPNELACDHIFEVAQPVQSWGEEVLVANLPNRAGGSIYRIVASEDDTAVTQNGVGIGTIDAGQFIETAPITGNHVFAADKAIFVAQYMTGVTSPGATLGDPAMGNMVPAAQYLSSYTFSTVGGSQFVQNFLTVIAETADIGTITLDGAPIGAGAFTAIGSTGFSSATVALSQGVHTTVSAGSHGITVEGYNEADSYIYPGGALFQFINPTRDFNPPLCSAALSPGPPPVFTGSATDDRPSEDVNNNSILDPGEDLNGNEIIDIDTGVFFVQLAAGAVNLSLVTDPFVPGDGSVDFQVNIVDATQAASGTLVATDGEGNTCTVPLSYDGGPGETGTLILKRAYLYLGRGNPNDNGKLVVRMMVDDPEGTLAGNLVAGAVRVTVTDADSSWNVSRVLTGCVQRGARRVVCTPSRFVRAVFKQARRSADQWNVRLFLLKLPDAHTGGLTPLDNPLDGPVSVRLENGSEISLGQSSRCKEKNYDALVCK